MAEVYCPNMLLIEFDRYRSFYEPGAKKVTVTFYSFVENSESGRTEMTSRATDDLHFNEFGVLTYSRHFRNGSYSKTFYGYSENGQLLSMVTLERYTNRLLETREFVYDENGLMKKEIFHDYSSNSREPSTASSLIERDGDEIRLFHTGSEGIYKIIWQLDEHQRLIDEKYIGVSDDAEKVLLWRQLQWGENGEIVSDQLLKGSKEAHERFKTDEWSFEYAYNDKDHWIKEDQLCAGEIKYSTERQIEYY